RLSPDGGWGPATRTRERVGRPGWRRYRPPASDRPAWDRAAGRARGARSDGDPRPVVDLSEGQSRTVPGFSQQSSQDGDDRAELLRTSRPDPDHLALIGDDFGLGVGTGT